MTKPTHWRGVRIWGLPALACILWLGFVAALYGNAAELAVAHRLELEHTRLSTVARQTMDARNWNAAHGGVFVLQSEYGQPNPWLPEAERTVTTTDGLTLVRMNPAYMSRQLAERSSWPGVRIAIISKQPLRQNNHSDLWETRALDDCMLGAQEVFSPPEQTDDNSLRLLSVLVAQPSCLRCHTGSREGDVLGGISISQDATGFTLDIERHLANLRMFHGLLGLTGVLAVGGLTLNLSRRRWKAEETSRMKSAFMARLSHDMRTPLMAINGMGELLRDGQCSPEERDRALRYLLHAGDTLLEMVNDITDHGSLEQGSIQLRERDFSLGQCISQCMEIYQPAITAKELDFGLVIAPDAMDSLHGDDFRLRQALGNLVSNAVKFTDRGGIAVRAATRPCKLPRPGRLELSITVEDSGPGLEPGEIRHIFDSFERGAQAVRQPGTGLGLNIARTIARRMGGDVRVQPREGGGSVFVLTVLVREGQDGTAATGSPQGKASPHTASQLHGKRILIAEDNAASRYYLAQALRKAGCKTLLLEDGRAALTAMREQQHSHQWDLVLLDVNMPHGSGLDVLREIRHGRTLLPADQKVALYTAALDEDARLACKGLQPDAVIIKPLDFASLSQRLALLMDTSTGNAPDTATADAPSQTAQELPMPPKPDALPVWDASAALAAMDGDREIFVRLLAVLQQDLLRMREELATALAPAGGPDATGSVRRLAHACKNSAGTMRLDRLHAVAALAEKAEQQHLPQAGQELLAAITQALDLLAEHTEGTPRPEGGTDGTDPGH